MTDAAGTTVGKFCPNCGAPHEPGAKFCESCGQALIDGIEQPATAATVVAAAAVPPPAVPVPPPAAPGAPVPPSPAAQVEPGHLDGEHDTTVNVYQYGAAGTPGAAVPAPGTGATVAGLRQGHVHVAGRKIHVLPILAGIALIVSGFFDWFVQKGLPGRSGYDAGNTFKFLFDVNNPGNGLKLGVVVLILGLAGILLTLFSPVRKLLGLAAIAVALAYAGQLYHLLDNNGRSFGDLFSYLGPGPYVALVAGIFLMKK